MCEKKRGREVRKTESQEAGEINQEVGFIMRCISKTTMCDFQKVGGRATVTTIEERVLRQS